ncbi:hypothetical protein ACFYXS_04775 [Streptomyces sp. NPDC002574]|uniref:hypothetical protein n=1 Tax=Streptomyces sp. NPDC002574 TaxID=3364652 RepID=UPI00369EF8D3
MSVPLDALNAVLPGRDREPVHHHRRLPVSFSLPRLLHSARVYTLTALEVAVLGAGSDLMTADPGPARSADRDPDRDPLTVPAPAGRHRAVSGVSGVSGASEALR